MKVVGGVVIFACVGIALVQGQPSRTLAQEPDQARGARLFMDNCAECHQRDGRGIQDIYPALAGNEVVLGSGVDVALVLLIGRGEMPSFAGAMTSSDMATIINYVRNTWGNSGQPITPQTIESLR